MQSYRNYHNLGAECFQKGAVGYLQK